jgi:phosphoglycolate phosphatase-like HAD superfamily hydrolase
MVSAVQDRGEDRTGSTVLVLWDVDGTLISDPRGMRMFFEDAAERLLGRSGIAPPERINGSTDYEILRKLLIREGFAPADAALLVPSALHELEALTARPEVIRNDAFLLPGVAEAIRALDDAGAIQSYVTGNSRTRAWAKLAAFDLHRHLDMRCGGFGDQTGARFELVDEARRRAGLLYHGRDDAIDLKHTFVVGDTIHDISAARNAGARSIAIATGVYALEELREHEPDLLIADLEGGLEDLRAFVCGPSRWSGGTARRENG